MSGPASHARGQTNHPPREPGPPPPGWGDNQHGDLGIGNTVQQDLPQQVTS
jgi:hypothetical protein